MKFYVLGSALFIGCLSFSTCQAGKIVIVKPTPQESQSETGAEQNVDEARRYLEGNNSHSAEVYVEGDGSTTNQAEELRNEASEYLDPPSEVDSDGQTILILRTEPSTGAKKARLKARSYVVPAGSTEKCIAVAENQVGTVGGESVENSSSEGASVVHARCK